MAINLTPEQKSNIKKYLDQFQSRLRHELSDKGWQKERREKTVLYQQLLSSKSVDNLSEKGFSKILRSLWSASFWTNKEYFVNKVLERNSIDTIRKGLRDLLYGRDQISKRFDAFMERVKGLGPSAVTERMSELSADKNHEFL